MRGRKEPAELENPHLVKNSALFSAAFSFSRGRAAQAPLGGSLNKVISLDYSHKQLRYPSLRATAGRPYGIKYRTNLFNLKSAMRISSAIIAAGDVYNQAPKVLAYHQRASAAYHPRRALYIISAQALYIIRAERCISSARKRCMQSRAAPALSPS